MKNQEIPIPPELPLVKGFKPFYSGNSLVIKLGKFNQELYYESYSESEKEFLLKGNFFGKMEIWHDTQAEKYKNYIHEQINFTEKSQQYAIAWAWHSTMSNYFVMRQDYG